MHDLGSAYRAALRWVRTRLNARLDGADAAGRGLEPSLGRLVSTLLDCGERPLAERALASLIESQGADGSWAGSPVHSTARETADAVRGLVAALPSRRDVESAIRRACEWSLASGRPVLATTGDAGAGLSLAAALDAAAKALDEGRLSEAARSIVKTGDAAPLSALRAAGGAVGIDAHSHQDSIGFLLDLGRVDAVAPILRDAEQDDGRSLWCATCDAQLASAWYRIGRRAPADRTLARLLSAQDVSGALPESVGPGDAARPARQSLAATRELLEAIHRHIAGAFAIQVDGFGDRIRQGDGRFAFLLQEAGSLAGRRVLDAGCGRGAIARALLAAYPSAAIVAVDVSPEMLGHIPPAVPTRRGSIQNLPFEEGTFDVAYCVETLEHACNPEGAVDELCRVVRPGGRVLVVDKNAERKGALDIEAWESWFDRREVEVWLGNRCDDVSSRLLVHCPELGPELFIGWRGTRR